MAPKIRQIPPHGGVLINRELKGELREAALERVRSMPKVVLDRTRISDLEMIAVGAFSPLTGFMGRADYESVVEEMYLQSGLVWTIPIVLPVDRETADRLKLDQEVALVAPDGTVLGILELAEKYTYDKEREAEKVYRTTEDKHPGVARLYRQGEVYLAGDVWLLNRPPHEPFPELWLDPAETRRLFLERGWRRVVGFQTRNPLHRAHEHIQKTALEVCDGLLIHPLVGETKKDDVPAEVRIQTYQAIIRDYYPPDRVLLAVFPAAMRYAGPREAVFHALCRKNYGCTHFIVGRDHAGVGNYYGTYDAQYIFDEFLPEEIGITPLFFEHTFYCRKCGGMASYKTCPHGSEDRVILSGTKVREMLQRGEMLPPEFTRPEVAKILIEAYRKMQAREEGAEAAVERAARQALEVVEAQGTEHLLTSEDLRRQRRRYGEEEGEEGPGPPPPRGDGRGRRRKVFLLGLDCVPPRLVFEEWRDQLPNLRQLMEGGTWGPLRSIVPPITVPAWMAMLTGRDPGQLGIYGFRNRADYSYNRMAIASSKMVRAKTVWDHAGEAGLESLVVGIPPTYPPRPIRGHLITSFLTPSTESAFTYPTALREEVLEVAGGEYLFDVPGFRTDRKDWLLEQLYRMTQIRFRVLRHLVRTKAWDLATVMEIATDRLHHGFWKFYDPEHVKHEPNSKYATAIFDYYRYLDEEIGRLLELLDDDTVVLVVSDHGAKRLDGAFCLNEWLIREGYLALKETPERIVSLAQVEVDWSRTVAWGAGGYYGRIFLNVRGREPQGVVDPTEYEAVRDELIRKLEALTGPDGEPMGNRAYRPEDLYPEVRGIAPDLILILGDLYWRSAGTVGRGGEIFTRENDTGPDDANHDWDGIFILYDPAAPGQGGPVQGRSLLQVAPTLLALLGLEVPAEMPQELLAEIGMREGATVRSPVQDVERRGGKIDGTPRVHVVAHRPFGGGEDHPGRGAGANPAGAGAESGAAGRGRGPQVPVQGPGVHQGGPAAEPGAGRLRGQAPDPQRGGGHLLLHLPLPGGPPLAAPGDRPFCGGVREGLPGGGDPAGPQGVVQAGPGRGDRELHGDLGPVRGAGEPGDRGGHGAGERGGERGQDPPLVGEPGVRAAGPGGGGVGLHGGGGGGAGGAPAGPGVHRLRPGRRGRRRPGPPWARGRRGRPFPRGGGP